MLTQAKRREAFRKGARRAVAMADARKRDARKLAASPGPT